MDGELKRLICECPENIFECRTTFINFKSVKSPKIILLILIGTMQMVLVIFE